jgi:hypothetical protein
VARAEIWIKFEEFLVALVEEIYLREVEGWVHEVVQLPVSVHRNLS